MEKTMSPTMLRFAALAVLAGCGSGETETVRFIKNFVSSPTTGGVSGTGTTGSMAATTTTGSGGASSVTSTADSSVAAGGSTVAQGGSGGSSGGSGSGGSSQGTGGGAIADAGEAGPPMNGPINVLVFNHTAGYGHQSRTTSIPLFQAAAMQNNINFDLKYAHTATLPESQNDTYPRNGVPQPPPDLSAFVSGGLDKYDVVFFLNTTGHVFQGTQETVHQQALQEYMEKKHGGFVGTHSATDTYDENWQWYQDFVGSIYNGHSNGGTNGSARWKDGVTHPILSLGTVPNPWARSEEWYQFRRDVGGLPDFTVLLLGNAPGLNQSPAFERPITWVHNVPGGGRLFYTAFGHGVGAFMEPAMMKMIMTGIKWAAHRIN
jgi:type 1 glutamine amidotransferase